MEKKVGQPKLTVKENRDADSLQRRMRYDRKMNDRDNEIMGGDIQGPGPEDYDGDRRYAAWVKKYGKKYL